MHFSRTGRWLTVVRTTGPTHNLLSLNLIEGLQEARAEIETLDPIGSSAPLIERNDVLTQVIEGVSDANRQFGTKYRVGQIRFVPNDSPPVETYRALAHAIVERLVTGDPIVEKTQDMR